MTHLPLRSGPRPLPLHLALEGWILSSSFAGLMTSNAGLNISNPESPDEALLPPRGASARGANPDGLAALRAAALDPVRFIDALTRQSHRRMTEFLAGIAAYQTHPHRRSLTPAQPVWSRGAAVVRSVGGEGPAVLFVPSLVNRAYILDLAHDRSLLRACAAAGLGAYLLDWGEPSAAELAFSLGDYVAGVLIPAVERIAAISGGPVRLAGYCMGGMLTTAVAVLRPDLVRGMALLAAPWDFHCDSQAARALMSAMRAPLAMMIGAERCASVDLLQALFASLDPTLVGRKFRSFAAIDQNSEEARRFVELEDWLNDGVPLAGPVIMEVLDSWYGANTPAAGRWLVAGRPVDPTGIGCPTLALIPSQDRIVPPDSARALARAIPGASIRDVPFGHIGMVAGGSAPKRVYAPLMDWLRSAA